MELSIIIVTWNCREYTDSCVRSIEEQTRSSHEIIVVDNGSSDGGADALEVAFPFVRVIRNRENLGFAAAVNQALLEAHGHLILLLNPDVLILDGAIDQVLSFMDRRPDVGAVGCRLVDPDGMTQKSTSRFPNLLDAVLEYLLRWIRQTGAELADGPRAVDAVTGAFLMVRRRVLDSVGPLSPRYFMYVEDIDWCYRINEAGWLIYYYPEARILHYGGRSSRWARRQMFVELHRSRLGFYRTHHRPVQAQIFKIITVAGLAVDAFVGAVRLVLKGSMTWHEYFERLSSYPTIARL